MRLCASDTDEGRAYMGIHRIMLCVLTYLGGLLVCFVLPSHRRRR